MWAGCVCVCLGGTYRQAGLGVDDDDSDTVLVDGEIADGDLADKHVQLSRKIDLEIDAARNLHRQLELVHR